MAKTPTRWIKHLEIYTCLCAAAISVLVALLDFFGLLHAENWKWLGERIPTITLLIVGMSLGLIAVLIIHHINQLEEELCGIKKSVEATIPEKLASIRNLVDPNLDRVIGSHVADLLEQINRVIRDRTYELDDLELFRAFYKRALEAYKGSHFVATSVPSERFFWRNQSTERAMARFISEGGKITRIFFVSTPEELNTEEARRILVAQSEMGVEVYTALTVGVPGPLRRFFMVEKEGRIAWEPFRSPDNSITGINLTSNSDITAGFLRSFRELLQLDCTQRYVPSTTFIDPHANFQSKLMTNMPAVPVDPQEFKEFEHRGWELSVNAYDKYFGPLTQSTIGPLLDGSMVAQGSVILDVATGPGYAAAAALRRGAQVTAVDFSQKMIAKARTLNDNHISFEVADAEELPFEGETFDSVVMNFGVLHLSQPEKSFSEAHRVLKPGGMFGFTVWAKPDEAEGFALILKAIEICGNSNAPLPAGPPFFRFSDPTECEESLEKAGFVCSRAPVKLPLVWELNSAEEVFKAFYEGTARTGGLLRVQSPDALEAIRNAVYKSCQRFQVSGKLRIPMPALVVIGQKQ